MSTIHVPPREPAPWDAAGNDYRGILDRDPAPPPTVTVVVTVGSGVAVGAATATLDSLGADHYPGDVEIVTVGAAGPVPDRAGTWPVLPVDPDSDDVATRRNLGAAVAGGEILIFLDAGSLVDPGFIEQHTAWHRRADNTVVTGHTPGTTPDGDGDDRSRNERRSRLLLVGGTGFLTLPTSNMSVRRRRFDPTGGFTPWLAVGTDAMLGWRLWNDGAFVVPDWSATATLPAVAGTTGDDPGLAGVLADRIPHAATRPLSSPLASVPKVSWLVAAATAETADAARDAIAAGPFGDIELVVHGRDEAVGHLTAVAASNPKLSVVIGEGPDVFAEALAASTGELVAFLDARVTPPVGLLAKAVHRMDTEPEVAVLRHAYRIGGDRYLRLDDLLAVDSAVGPHGLPLFAIARRRELMKRPDLLAAPHAAWAATVERSVPALVITSLVDLDDPRFAAISPPPTRRPGLGDLPALGVRELARSMVKEFRRRTGSSDDRTADAATTGVPTTGDPVAAAGAERLSVAYVGFTGHDNLGDEAVMLAIQRLMPWADLQREPVDPRLVMVGGGTLLNGRRYYLNRMLRQESAVVERALFGTGVRSPEYWGVTEPMEEWFGFIDSALFAAVRGPDSVVNLRTMGYHRDLPVIGDPALSLFAPEGTERVDGRVVVCPVYTTGNLHGGSDDVVFDALATTIARLRADGREVVMLSAFPQDDRWVIDLMRRAGAADMPYVAGYADLDATMGLLGSADVVIGERLHASIMAAAAGTPFVALEYRPKVRDFARSVGQEAAVIRTDEMDRLDAVTDRIIAERDEVAAAIAVHVEEYRRLQRKAAFDLHASLVDVGTITEPDATPLAPSSDLDVP